MYQENLEIKDQVVKRVKERLSNEDYIQNLDYFLYTCESEKLSPKTISSYAERLGVLFRYLESQNVPFHKVSKHHIREFTNGTIDKYSTATVNGRLRAFRRAWNVWINDDMWNGENPMKGVRFLKEEKRVKEVLEPKDIQKILNTVSRKYYEGARNYLMILLLFDGMLRKSEMMNLRTGDVDLESGLITVLGKGNKQRQVPLGMKTLRYFKSFMVKWRSKYPGDIVIAMRTGEMLSGRSVNQIFERISERVGKRIYPHLFRHSAATLFIRQGGSLAVLQQILGHASISITVDVYGHLTGEDSLRAYQQMSPTMMIKVKR